MKRSAVSNENVRTPFRIVLPTTIGALSGMLTAWDVHNWSVVRSMGMAWDTGAPVWPYQTSDILLRFLNLPAFVVAIPLANLFRVQAPEYHLLVFPIGLAWWWLTGLWVDRRSINRPHQWRWFTLGACTICAGLLLSAMVADSSLYQPTPCVVTTFCAVLIWDAGASL